MATKPLPKFVRGSYSNFKSITPDSNTIYFITDSEGRNQLFLGSTAYSMTPVVLGSTAELPAASAAIKNAIYYKQKDNTAYLFDGTTFHALSVPKTTVMDGSLSSDDGTLPTTYAVQEFVGSQVSSSADEKLDKISGTNGNILTIASAGSAVADSGLIAGGAALASTPVSTTLATEKAVADADAAVLGSAKSYADSAAEDAASSAVADKLEDFAGTNGHLVIVASAGSALADAGVTIGGAALAAEPTSTVLATEKAVKDYTDSQISALGTVFNYKGTVADMAALEAIVDPKAGDVYTVTSVAGGSSAEFVRTATAWEELGTALDLSGYVTKVVPAATGNIATLAADGNVQDSSKSIGGATLNIVSSAASADVIATEAAVKAYADSVASAAAGAYIPFVPSAVNGNIAVFASTGEKLADTGLVAGGATLDSTPASTTLATEAAVAAADAVVSSALDEAKLDKISGTNGNILTVASDGEAVADSGLKAGSATLAASPVSTTLATEAAVAAAISSASSTLDNAKYDKISSASSHTDKVMFFGADGQTVADKSIGVDVASFAATPSSTTLATEAAVADYVTSALQEIAWTDLA